MRRYATLLDRIRANSRPSETLSYEGTPCWMWMAKVKPNRRGTHYGVINIRVKGVHTAMPAHRAAVIASGRTLRRDHVVKHLCNNPLCVNPDHLKGGTQSTNMRQCYAEGRSNLCAVNGAA